MWKNSSKENKKSWGKRDFTIIKWDYRKDKRESKKTRNSKKNNNNPSKQRAKFPQSQYLSYVKPRVIKVYLYAEIHRIFD